FCAFVRDSLNASHKGTKSQREHKGGMHGTLQFPFHPKYCVYAGRVNSPFFGASASFFGISSKNTTALIRMPISRTMASSSQFGPSFFPAPGAGIAGACI